MVNFQIFYLHFNQSYYVLEIYFVDYYDGALHYYIIDKLLKLNCHFSRGPLFFHCQVIVRERR